MGQFKLLPLKQFMASGILKIGAFCNLGAWGAIWVLMSGLDLAGLNYVRWNGAVVGGVRGVLVITGSCAMFAVIGIVLMMVGWGVLLVVGRFVPLGGVAFLESESRQPGA
jgi:hypothetical protein